MTRPALTPEAIATARANGWRWAFITTDGTAAAGWAKLSEARASMLWDRKDRIVRVPRG